MLWLFRPVATPADVGIIVALSSQEDQLKPHLKRSRVIEKAGRKFHCGQIEGTEVVLTRSPMGKVNNAITAQLLLSDFPVDIIISIGLAGAIDQSLQQGDIVVASEIYQHDFGAIKPYGFIWNKVPDRSSRDDKGYSLTDKHLRVLALKSASRFSSKDKNGFRAVEGLIVTGDQFISSPKKREWLHKKFKAKAVDMSAAAIAQVCYENKACCCFIRVISDQAGVSARDNFGSFARSISKKKERSVGIVKEMLKEMAQNKPRGRKKYD